MYYRLSSVAKQKDEIYIVGSVKKIFKILGYNILDISKKTAKMNLRGKMIANKIIFQRQVMKTIRKFVDLEIRFIPDEFLSPTATIIFKNFVGYFNYVDEPFIVLVEDKLIANSYRDYFNKMWKIARS